MIIKSIPDWLKEQEEKHHSIFLLEWVSTFACAFVFWFVLFSGLELSPRSTAAAATTSVLYACGFVYLRIFPVTRCKKCSSPLPLLREEIGRRHVHDEERTVEIERGGEDYWGHQGERILILHQSETRQDLEQIVLLPTSQEALALDAALTDFLVLEQVQGHMPKQGKVFRPVAKKLSLVCGRKRLFLSSYFPIGTDKRLTVSAVYGESSEAWSRLKQARSLYQLTLFLVGYLDALQRGWGESAPSSLRLKGLPKHVRFIDKVRTMLLKQGQQCAAIRLSS